MQQDTQTTTENNTSVNIGENENTRKNTMDKVQRPWLAEPWDKGVSGNPKGRPKGSRSFKTVFFEALEMLAKENKKDPNVLFNEIVAKGIKQAHSGDFKFYQDLMNRIFGKPLESVDITSAGEKIERNDFVLVNFDKKTKQITEAEVVSEKQNETEV